MEKKLLVYEEIETIEITTGLKAQYRKGQVDLIFDQLKFTAPIGTNHTIAFLPEKLYPKNIIRMHLVENAVNPKSFFGSVYINGEIRIISNTNTGINECMGTISYQI